MTTTKNLVRMILLMIITIYLSNQSFAEWYAGVTHTHTGFSTFGGYPTVDNSRCPLLIPPVLAVLQQEVHQDITRNEENDDI